MFYEQELRFLQKTLDKCHIPNGVIDPTAPTTHPSMRHLTRGRQSAHCFYDIVPPLAPATVYRLLDAFLCRYIFLELPYCEQPSVLLIGPYLHNNITEQQILEQAERLQDLSSVYIRELELFYSTVPVVHEEHHLFAMVNTLAESIFDGESHFTGMDLYLEHSTPSPPDFIRDHSAGTESVDALLIRTRCPDTSSNSTL